MAANDAIMRLDMVEQSTMQAILEAPTLPKVSSTDNGKILGVSSGNWKVVSETKELPSVSGSDNGKLLGVSDGKWKAIAAPTELPAAPEENGTYHLSITVSSGTATLSWVAEQE